MKSKLSRAQVKDLLGDLDDVTTGRIIATRADLTTLVKALHDVEQSFILGERVSHAPADRAYNRVRSVLVELMNDDDELAYIDYATD